MIINKIYIMADFYHRYKDLFLTPQKISKIQNSQNFRSPSYSRRNSQNQNYFNPEQLSYPRNFNLNMHQKKHVDRFQTQILPKINILNNYQASKRIETEKGQLNKNYDIFWSPQINKNKEFKKSIFQIQQRPMNETLKKNSQYRKMLRNQRVKTQINNSKKEYLSPNYIQKPQKSPYAAQIPTQDKIHLGINFDEVHLPFSHMNKTKKKFGLQFSEFEPQNQYQFVGKRLNDIRRAQKFYPRGYINDYRQALIRRVHAKQDIQSRRKKLKGIFIYEKTLYERHIPII